MADFDLNNLKKTWQEQTVAPKYDSREIESMLNKSSRNYVKYILWISIAEFLLILVMNCYYTFIENDAERFLSILERLGVKSTLNLKSGFTTLYLMLKLISSLLIGVFVILFYRNYKKIKVESNLKNLIGQIIKFKRTVNIFILANISLLIIFSAALSIFIFKVLGTQHIELEHYTLTGLIVGLVMMTLISVILIWIYYRIFYGIIIKRLGKNLLELQKIDEGN